MASRIGKRLLAGIVIGLILGGALGVSRSTGKMGELETRIKELETVGPSPKTRAGARP